MKKIYFYLGLMLLMTQQSYGQCGATASPDATIGCGASYAMTAQTNAVVYSVIASACPPVAITGTNAFPTPCDDCVTGQINIGFPFNFYGNVYTTAVIQSNGILGFGAGWNFTGFSSFAIPAGGAPNNYIAGVFADIDIRNGGTITYQTVGIAPNRQFVVSYNNVATYGPGTGTASFQIVLNENGSFQVIISQFSANWSTTWGPEATSGAENIDGTLAFPVPGRNATDWPGIVPGDLDCHIFNPVPCIFTNWAQGATILSTNPNYSVSPLTTTTYTANWNCGGTPCSRNVVVTVANSTLTLGAVTNNTGCGVPNGSIPLTFANVPNGTYVLTYSKDGVPTNINVTVTGGIATLSGLNNGTYTAFSIPSLGGGCANATAAGPRVITSPNLPTGTGVTICQGGSGSLTSSFVCPATGTSIAQGATFNSGTLATSDPTWVRNGGGTTCNGSAGTTYYYDVFSFTVSTAGSYTFDGCGPPDLHASLYQNAFNGANPCGTPANFIIANDDGNPAGGCGLDPRLTATLSPGVTYFIVTTTFSGGTTGTYGWRFTGPAGATIITGGGPAGTLQWYTAATGGSAIGTGSPFNPVGVAGSGLANTNTAGTTTYYLACSTSPTCRTPITYVINSNSTSPTITPVVASQCPDVNLTLNSTGGVAGAGSTVRWYTGPNGTGTYLGTGASVNITTPNATTTYYVRREGTCNNSTDNSIVVTIKNYIYGLNGSSTASYCTDNNGWHHFYNGNEILLSVQGDLTGANPGFPQITINENGSYYQQSAGPFTAPSCASGLSPGEERFEMERSWDVDFGPTGIFNPPYNVRFYYQAAERTAIENAAATWMSTYTACSYTYKYANPLGFYWFKNSTGNYTAPLYDGLHLAGANGTTANGVNYAELTGLTSFSGGSGGVILSPDPLLNVGFLYFDGETDNKTNSLRWATEVEKNSDRFNIQRSLDGINFITIGAVAAKGNSTTTQHYTFDDVNPFTGENYYRLELLSLSGKVDYSTTIRLNITEDGKGYNFYPNPTTDVVYYQYETRQKDELKIEVLDVLGKQIINTTVTSNVGINKIPVDLTGFPMGTYMVRVHNSNTASVHTSKVVKNK